MIQQLSISDNGGTELEGADVSSATLSVGGANIPLLGFGTYGMSGAKLQNVLVAALRQGFRHIDTAQMYQNESDVGAAIPASGVARSSECGAGGVALADTATARRRTLSHGEYRANFRQREGLRLRFERRRYGSDHAAARARQPNRRPAAPGA